jgi:hypothetical protein
LGGARLVIGPTLQNIGFNVVKPRLPTRQNWLLQAHRVSQSERFLPDSARRAAENLAVLVDSRQFGITGAISSGKLSARAISLCP